MTAIYREMTLYGEILTRIGIKTMLIEVIRSELNWL